MIESAVFSERRCEVCPRHEGGHPTAGLDNVVIHSGRQLCGHHQREFVEWFYSRQEDALAKWIERRVLNSNQEEKKRNGIEENGSH